MRFMFLNVKDPQSYDSSSNFENLWGLSCLFLGVQQPNNGFSIGGCKKHFSNSVSNNIWLKEHFVVSPFLFAVLSMQIQNHSSGTIVVKLAKCCSKKTTGSEWGFSIPLSIIAENEIVIMQIESSRKWGWKKKEV